MNLSHPHGASFVKRAKFKLHIWKNMKIYIFIYIFDSNLYKDLATNLFYQLNFKRKYVE